MCNTRSSRGPPAVTGAWSSGSPDCASMRSAAAGASTLQHSADLRRVRSLTTPRCTAVAAEDALWLEHPTPSSQGPAVQGHAGHAETRMAMFGARQACDSGTCARAESQLPQRHTSALLAAGPGASGAAHAAWYQGVPHAAWYQGVPHAAWRQGMMRAYCQAHAHGARDSDMRAEARAPGSAPASSPRARMQPEQH